MRETQNQHPRPLKLPIHHTAMPKHFLWSYAIHKQPPLLYAFQLEIPSSANNTSCVTMPGSINIHEHPTPPAVVIDEMITKFWTEKE